MPLQGALPMLKIVTLLNIHTGQEVFIIQLPSGKVLGNATFNTKIEAQSFLTKVLKDASELVAEFEVANA
jgi:hypothetical protein